MLQVRVEIRYNGDTVGRCTGTTLQHLDDQHALQELVAGVGLRAQLQMWRFVAEYPELLAALRSWNDSVQWNRRSLSGDSVEA